MQPLHGRLTVGAPPEPVPGVAAVERWPDPGSERDGLVGLDRNERVAPLPDWFVAELQSRLTSATASIYPTPVVLRDELADALDLPPESLLVTPGTDAALRAVHLAFVDSGARVVRLDPTYAMIPVYGRMFGANDVPVGFNRELELDTGALLDAIEPGTRLVILANPNQPTGTVLDGGVLEELAGRCAETGALLVLDEAYHGFSRVTGVPLLARSEHVVVLRTFSKAAGLAGLRVGYAAGSPAVVRALGNVRSAGEVNAVGIEAARLVVAHPEVVDDYVRLVDEGRRVLEQRVKALDVVPLATAANFLNLRLPGSASPIDVVEGLRRLGYLVRGPFDELCLAGSIRVTLGPPDLMGAFADALEEVFSELQAAPTDPL